MNHDHVAHVYEYIGAECLKLRQPIRAIFALSRTQLLLLVVTRSRDLSRECHVTKHKTPARSNFPLSNFENSGTIPFSSSSSTSRGLCPKIFEKRAHPNAQCLTQIAAHAAVGLTILSWPKQSFDHSPSNTAVILAHGNFSEKCQVDEYFIYCAGIQSTV